MTDGLRFLHAILSVGGHIGFRRVNSELFQTNEEKEVYGFIFNHFSNYGKLPSLDTVKQNLQISLPPVDESIEYYLDRLQQRYVWAILREPTAEFLRQIQARNMDLAVKTLRQMLNMAGGILDNKDSVVDFAEESKLVQKKYLQSQRASELLGVTLGYQRLDEISDGAQPGDIIVLAGRPAIGKTNIMLHMLNESWKAGHSPLLLSMEMSNEQVTRRLLGLQAGINPRMIRSGRLSTHDYDVLVETIDGVIERARFYMMKGGVRQSVANIDRAVYELSPDIVYIDAGYLVTPDPGTGRRSANRRELISDVIEGLKQVAHLRKIPIVVSVQFGRSKKKVRTKEDDGDDLSKIAETDVIAQVATIAIGMSWGCPPYEADRRVLSVMKNRDGALADIETHFTFQPPNFSFVQEVSSDINGENAVAAPNSAAVSYI